MLTLERLSHTQSSECLKEQVSSNIFHSCLELYNMNEDLYQKIVVELFKQKKVFWVLFVIECLGKID